MLKIFLGIIISYLIGSIPTAYIFTKALKGIDIRKVGSGNVGATNALRVLGKPIGLSVLFVDILKGFIPIFYLADIFCPYQWYKIVVGAGCVAGHIWPIFLGFKGGKGVATSLGMLIGLAVTIQVMRLPLVLSFLVWLFVFLVFKYVSLASIVTAVILPVFLLFFRTPLSILIIIVILNVIIIVRHKSNILRLLQKRENKIKLFSQS